MEICFLNVDLEIESTDSLDPVVKELDQENIVVLHHGPMRGMNHAALEIVICEGGAEDVINYFCSLVESLSNEARRVWDYACKKVFDIGYDSGDSPACFQSVIHPSTVKRVADIGGAITITIYARRDDDVRSTPASQS